MSVGSRIRPLARHKRGDQASPDGAVIQTGVGQGKERIYTLTTLNQSPLIQNQG